MKMHRHTKGIVAFAVVVVLVVICTALYQAYAKVQRAVDACAPGTLDNAFVLAGKEYAVCDVGGGKETRRVDDRRN